MTFIYVPYSNLLFNYLTNFVRQGTFSEAFCNCLPEF